MRCIKPNEEKSPVHIDEERCIHQVMYLGLLENVRVRRAGFAFRMPFTRFVNRSGIFKSPSHHDSHQQFVLSKILSYLCNDTAALKIVLTFKHFGNRDSKSSSSIPASRSGKDNLRTKLDN